MYFGLVDGNEDNKRTIIYKYPALFFTRRVLFALLVVWLYDWFVTQLIFLLICSYVFIYMIIRKEPYMLKSANRVEVWNELSLLLLTYHIMAFGGFTTYPWTFINFHIGGWSYVLIILTSLSVQTAYIFIISLNEACW